MRYAIINNSIINNIIVADESFITEHYPDAIECPENFSVGDKYENGEFSRSVYIVTEPEVTND
jgi:hypothetical protein